MSYWIISSEPRQGETVDTILSRLKGSCQQHCELGEPVIPFKVPQGQTALKFGSFDNLIRLTDELQKHDQSVEGTLRRIERQWLEADAKADFQVYLGPGQQRQAVPVERYLKNGWQWDEARYPTQRSLQANLDFLLERVSKMDEDVRNKAMMYNDFKTQGSSLSRRDGLTFPTRDLVDLLTPEVVEPTDFIETEHLTTMVVILGRGQEPDFLKWYERPSVEVTKSSGGVETRTTEAIDEPETVVPMSAKKFVRFPDRPEDKDGNTVWRVVLFKSCKEKFASLARQNKYLVRDFTYSHEQFDELSKKRAAVEKETQTTLGILCQLSRMAWSDVFTSWMHIKAMRCFVECVLRFGVKTQIAAFIIFPKPSAQQSLRKELANVLSTENGGKMAEAAEADGEEYYPYVSLAFAPRAVQRD